MRYKLTVLFAVFALMASALVLHHALASTIQIDLQHEETPGSDTLAAKGHTATQVEVVAANTPISSRGVPLDGNGLPAPALPPNTSVIHGEDPHPGAYVRSAGGVCPDNGAPFCTHLPIVSIDAGGAFPQLLQTNSISTSGNPVSETYAQFLRCAVAIYDSPEHVNHLSDTPTATSDGLFRPRGNSSLHFDKSSYKLHLTHPDNTENALAFLGMEEHDKWVLNGPILDKTLLRNYLGFSLAGSIRPETPDVRFFELFVNGRYQGVYLAMESVGAAKGRVPITRYKEGDPFASYILRADRDVNQPAKLDVFSSYAEVRSFTTAVEVLYPPAEQLTPELMDFIAQDVSKMEKALYSYDYNDPVYGYRATMDVDSFVDYFIVNELLHNWDAGLYSTYYYKDVRGKFTIGPMWDFNNALDNYIEDTRPPEGFTMISVPLYKMLIMDEYFIDSIIARYRDLRSGVLSDEAMTSLIDGADAWLGDAVTRNFTVWEYTFHPEMVDSYNQLQPASRTPANHAAAVAQMKEYLAQRCAWLDEHIDTLKQYCHESRNKKYYH